MTWNYNLNISDVFHNDDLSFEDKKKTIVDRIRSSSFFDSLNEEGKLEDIVNQLAESIDEEDFDYAWENFYDFADNNRVWVETV